MSLPHKCPLHYLSFFFLLLLLFISSFPSIISWKKDEFRNCNQTPFCKRARNRIPGSCTLIVSEISIVEGQISAKLISKPDNDSSEVSAASSYPLILTLSVYHGGILRFVIDEHESDDHTGKRRFRVPDVVVPDFHSNKLWLQRISTTTFDGDLSISSVFYLSDGFEAVVRHSPFEVYVRRKNGGRVASFNPKGLFDFEQLRQKNEGEDWVERFRSHSDSRPYGPQSISFDVSFYGADFVYGIPEHATSLALKPTRGPGVDDQSEPYRLFNLDVFEHLDESPFGLYGSIPFMISHGVDHGSSGFFWLNAAEMQIDVMSRGDDSGILLEKRVDTLWMSEAGVVDVFFFVGPGPKDVVKQYCMVTGKPVMPQQFAIGYHQCRWNYRDEEDVESVDAKFDEHDIPYDVLWLDIEHTNGKRYFTWDKLHFPDPVGMQKKLANKGRHMVAIVDPHVKRDESFSLHKEAVENGYYVKDASGRDFEGWCWAGSSSYPDVLNPEVRSWWSGKYSLENYVGSSPWLHIWNDMNEPSVFDGPEVTMPRDALHQDGIEHRELHNVYGYYFHMATYEGLVERAGNERPFVLSRAFFAGSQKYGSVWTGDNSAEWSHLRVSVPMLLTLGLTGMTFSGADIGGFFGNPDTELMVRWYQLGSFYPFYRAHAHLDSKRREPWLFGDRSTELIREAIRTRYSLLPFFYTLFREANTTGVPVIRPLWMEFPLDESTFSNDEAFIVGDSLLVQGVFSKSAKHVSVYLPGSQRWYDFRTGAAFSGRATHKLDVSLDSIPVFQRSGTIITRKDRARRSTTQMVDDPYTLMVALNSSMEAEGELYIDDGKSFDFATKAAYIHRRFTFSNSKLTSSSSPTTSQSFHTGSIVDRVVLIGCTVVRGDELAAFITKPFHKKVVVEMGPLWLHKKGAESVLTLRKPDVKIGEDWSIEISGISFSSSVVDGIVK